MASTKADVQRDKMLGGMDQSVRPHLIPETSWRYASGMRFHRGRIAQVPRKVAYADLERAHLYPVVALETIPTTQEGAGKTVALTQIGAWLVGSGSSVPLWDEEGIATFNHLPGQYLRWGTCRYNNRLFFVNPMNRVLVTDGAVVKQYSNAPLGHYVEVFYDHLVVGRPVGVETGIRWSHLKDFNQWVADSHTESDHFLCSEAQQEGEGVFGVTGMKRLSDALVTYTSSSIYVTRYTGLPHVMRTDAIGEDKGSGFLYGVVGTRRGHMFVDTNHRSFFVFDGESVQEIGQPVRDQFFSELSTNETYQQRLYGYVDRRFSEVHWVYCSTASSGGYDREVVFNYTDRVWWFNSVENVHSFTLGVMRGKTVDELAGTTVNGLTGTADRVSETTEVRQALYGGAAGQVYREEAAGDAQTSLVALSAAPTLETGDFLYGSLQQVKENDSMTIHSIYDTTAIDGLDVYHMRRNQVDETAAWAQVTQLWTPSLKERRLSLPRGDGVVHRFKFTPSIKAGNITADENITAPDAFSLRAEIPRSTAPYAFDTFESYSAGADPASGGYGFDAAWVITETAYGMKAYDQCVYTNGVAVAGLAGGDGWAGAWESY